ncbi:MAG: TatD family hydrolase [Candidatus Bipolaricaulota bacterium]|nr:TatD family hydrolase [Candidatus Bipolaricaulota bacterium]
MDRDLSAVARAGPPWDDGAEGVRPTIRTTELPTLDAHAHVDPARAPEELRRSGAVLAMTLSLDEAAQVIGRPEPQIAWGVGCHPRKPKAQTAFDASRFGELAERTAIVGEIGLDARWSRAAFEDQLRTFPVRSSTSSAGSLDSRASTATLPVVRESKFRTAVPPERILVESDHGWADPPAAIPCRIEWVEHLVAQQLGSSVGEVSVSCGRTWRGSSATRARSTSCLLPCGRFCAPVRTVKSDLAGMGVVTQGQGGRGLGVPLPGGASSGFLEDAAGSPRCPDAAWALSPR